MVSRRQALKLLGSGFAGGAMHSLFPRFFFKEALAQSVRKPVTVGLYLSGGWDAAAIVQPATGAAYDAARLARPTLAKTPENLRLITNDVGLHPSFTFLEQAYRAGDLIVFPTAGIKRGYSGSHEEAALDVFKGQFDGTKDVRSKGFLADILDAKYANSSSKEFVAFDLAPGNSILNDAVLQVIKASTITGRGFNDTIASNDRGLTQDFIYSLARDVVTNDQSLKVQNTVEALEATQIRIRQAVQNTTFSPAFPNTGVGNALRQVFVAVSNFIDFGLEAVTLAIGGYDTHNNQDPIVGMNQQPMGLSANLLQVDAALQAFVLNLERVGLHQMVTTFMYSEFGRTARENGSMGTDHGQGCAYFLLGGALNGGQVVGDLVTPADFNSGNNAVHVSVDAASIIAQIAEHMEVPRAVLYTPEVVAGLTPLPPLFT